MTIHLGVLARDRRSQGFKIGRSCTCHPADISEGFDADLPKEKRVRLAEDPKSVEDNTCEPVKPLRRSSRLAQFRLPKQELPAVVAEMDCVKNSQNEMGPAMQL